MGGPHSRDWGLSSLYLGGQFAVFLTREMVYHLLHGTREYHASLLGGNGGEIFQYLAASVWGIENMARY